LEALDNLGILIYSPRTDKVVARLDAAMDFLRKPPERAYDLSWERINLRQCQEP